MEVRRVLPDPSLRHVVRSFGERRAVMGGCAVIRAIPARPHQILSIYLAEPFRVRVGDGPLSLAPEAVVVGPQTNFHTQISMSGAVHVFNILFQPTGFHRLIDVDMAALVNLGIDCTDVIGARASALVDGVCLAADFSARVAAAERWIAGMLDQAEPADAIGHASRLLVATRGQARIDALVARSGLSARQFQRCFVRQVGLPPKLYARMVRFESALALHRNAPSKPWTEIVHQTGYFDQAHFIRDSRALAGAAPCAIADAWENIFFPRYG
jgi:AraC-like DNA-binding protein